MGQPKTVLSRNVRTMPKVTIVLPLSRDWRIDPMREQLETLDTSGLEIDLLVIVDSPDIRPVWLEAQWEHLHPRIIFSESDPIGESNSYARRTRIVDIMNLARHNTPYDAEHVFILEDDTQIEPYYLQKLVTLTRLRPDYGVITGIQAGRWAASMIGIWKTDNIDNPTMWETLNCVGQKLLQPVDATGIYCTITPAHLFRETPFRTTYQGPDVNYGLDVRQQGHQNYADWTLLCGHTLRQRTIWPTTQTGTVKFIVDSNSPGGWKQCQT